jgi:prevent-host-death family protein
MREAKARLSELLRAVAGGQEVEIHRSGRAVARLVPVVDARHREMGMDVGLVVIPENFDDALPPEIEAGF